MSSMGIRDITLVLEMNLYAHYNKVITGWGNCIPYKTSEVTKEGGYRSIVNVSMICYM